MRRPSPCIRSAAARTLVLPMLVAAMHVAAAHPAHAGPVVWRGLLDLAASEWSEATELNTLTRGDDPYDAARLRLFAEAGVTDHVRLLSQLVYAETSGAYLDGAYVSYTPWDGRDAHLLAGKVPWPIGTWAPRTYSNVNPLLSAPLMYQYHTTLLWYALPADADQLLATGGSGQTSVVYGTARRGIGMPIVDDSYWDVGLIVNGSQRPLEYALGVTDGAPSWASPGHDDNRGRTVLGRIGLVPAPWLRAGVSGAYGPYLNYALAPLLPPGRSVADYRQVLGMADLGLQTGHLDLEAEGARNTWQTPTVGDLRVDAGYVELKYEFMPGAWAAGRYDVERFGRIVDSAGDAWPWDADVTRIETGLGYRFSRAVLGKLVYQHDALDRGRPGVEVERSGAIAAQLSIGF